MKRPVFSLVGVMIIVTSISALQFAAPFSKIGDALALLREKNLSKYEAQYWRRLPGQKVQCRLCPNLCVINDLARGACGVRLNLDGKLYSLVYGQPIAVHVDPIEKKPLSHFLPGTTVYSLATAGCNLGCLFCQNWQISQTKPEDADHADLAPAQLVAAALDNKCPSIAYTYTEPTVFYEYMLATAKLARRAGVKNVMHSCGYINPEPLQELLPYLDAANIDLKGFSEDYYRKMCFGRLAPVLTTLKMIKRAGVWLEITNLIVPGQNDDPEMIRSMCRWIKANLGPDVPLYFAAFQPQYKLRNLPPTPVESLEQAYQIATAAGLNYVYIGNVYGHLKESTVCPRCHRIVLKRAGYTVEENNLLNGRCKFCGNRIPGVWR